MIQTPPIIGYLYNGKFYKSLDKLPYGWIIAQAVYDSSYVEALINKHDAIMKILMADN